MISLILAAAIVSQTPPRPQDKQATQERSVIAARRMRRSIKNKATAVREAQDADYYRQQEIKYEQAVTAQKAYEVKMGPIWAAQHANEIQQQRNALIAQANQIAKYRADYEIWLQMQQNAINAAAVQALQNQRR